jgi:hypothetical protein
MAPRASEAPAGYLCLAAANRVVLKPENAATVPVNMMISPARAAWSYQ